MKKVMIAVATAGVSASLFAGLYGDTPDAKHAWSVHDMNRPNPAKVEPGAQLGQPPCDAVVLFDGTKASFEKNWCDSKGNPSQWKWAEGEFYCVPQWKNGGDIFTRQAFGDCQLHLEYRHDASLGVTSDGAGPQMHGNSGVFIMGNYELQILESYGTNPKDMKNPNYADGQAGAVYAENPPMVNPAKKPGEWQVYDIVFHQPVWEGNKLVHPGSVTLFFNGVLVQDHWEMEGLTTHCRRRPLAPHATKGQLHFQDHGCPVHFRNIWIREIPSRWANTTHASLSGKEADVMALRNRTAKSLLAKIDVTKSDAATVNAVLEVLSYSTEEPFLGAAVKICSAYAARLEKMDDAALDKAKDEILWIRRSYDVLWRNNVAKDCPLGALIVKTIEKRGWNKKK